MTESVQGYVTGEISRVAYVFLGCLIALGLTEVLVIVGLMAMLDREKECVFKAFLTLPKSAISATIERLNMQSGRDSEGAGRSGNAPEDKALRVLSSTSSHRTGHIGFNSKIRVLMGVHICASLVMMALAGTTPQIMASRFTEIVPVYHAVVRAHVNIMASLVLLLRVALSGVPLVGGGGFNDTYPDDYAKCVSEARQLVFEVHGSNNILRFGSAGTGSGGVAAVGSDLIALLSKSAAYGMAIPKRDIDILEVLSYDSAMHFIARLLGDMISNISGPEGASNYNFYAVDDARYDLVSVWLLGMDHQKYMIPALDMVQAKVDDETQHFGVITTLVPTLILCTVIVLCGFMIIPVFERGGAIAMWIPRLLLFCDPDVVLASTAIVKMLSNEYRIGDTGNREENTSAHGAVASNMPDGVVFMANDLTIISFNRAVATILGKTPDEITGGNLRTLFVPPPGQDTSLRQFLIAIDYALNARRSPCIDEEVDVLRDGKIGTLRLRLSAVSTRGDIQTRPTFATGLVLVALTITDMTSDVEARSMLHAETEKNEDLLATLLPPPVARQLQLDDGNVLFTVQNLSVGVLNIVNFTGWAEDLPPERVMSALDRVVSGYDAIRQGYPRLTKVKVYGDRYIVAGGLFQEMSQQDEDARQVVAFCDDAVEMVRAVNRELGETLAIRVGCHAGGPAAAGVLGTTMPSFDVIGQVMSVAHVMEQTGVANQVHVSDSVYQLIYYQGFIIKEGPDVETHGKVFSTCLISGVHDPNA